MVIGLELGDGPLLHKWSQAGELTALKSLIDNGCWGWLETTADDLHISAWPSIYTGSSPGEHGVYFTYQPAPGVQGYRRFAPGLYGRPTFWRMASEAGRRCVVFDAPYTHPEEGFSGTQIFDWGTWAHYLQSCSTPAEALGRLDSKFGPYPLGLEAHDLGLEALDPNEAGRRAIKGIEAKTAATRWLMTENDWQLLFAVFGETHFAGHYCWTPAAVAASEPSQEPLFDVYKAIDQGIAAICDAAGDDATIIVISGDGVGPNHAGWHLLPDILGRLGYFASRDVAAPGASSEAQARFDPVRFVRDLLPKDLRKSLARRLPASLRDKLGQRVDTAYVDWSKTRAYCLPTDLEGYIRINLRGREPMGVVEPGSDYSKTIEDLTRAIEELSDPTTGRAIVREVICSDRAFAGERRPYLPDLVVRWENSAPITRAASPRIGIVEKEAPDARPGTHRAPGFVLASGPGIAGGTTLDAGHIFDLAPTVLARLGVDRPAHMRGRVWREFLDA